jgi:hypothetical protein
MSMGESDEKIKKIRANRNITWEKKKVLRFLELPDE